ncbi:hypothetical protein L6R52_00840 [Myxococcota bacterium]|nr:hypothetical protein [Myxococcota bacterium]
MDSEIERVIIHYYPQRALVSPLASDAITWDYDTGYATLKSILAALKALDPELKPGTRGRYDISEELVIVGGLRLQLSYLGPFAALNHGLDRELDEDARELARRATEILERHGVRVLSEEELDERVPWIQLPKGNTATVWSCLFVLPEG